MQERKRAKQAQMCFHYIKDTCTFGDECRYSHDLSDYVKAKPADLPGECPFSSLEKCPFSLTCRWATKHKNPDEHTKKWLLSKLPGSCGAHHSNTLVYIRDSVMSPLQCFPQSPNFSK